MTVSGDALLDKLRQASDEDRDREIERIIVVEARPLIARILARQARSGSALTPDDADDLAGIVVLRLIERLRSIDESAPLESFERYVATLVHNAVSDHFRRAFPERTALRNRLRNGGFAIWPTSVGTACGRAEWEGALPGEIPANVVVSNDLSVFFASIGHAVLFDEMATLFTTASAEPAAVPSVSDTFERRETLQKLWREILELRPMQRKALLLNLRGEGSMNIASLLVVTGTAKLAQIAAAVEMTLPELRAIWNDLPLDDLRIASLLGITRQHVIDLRRAARVKLARKVKS